MDPDNGQVNESGFEPGSIATYTCNSGYSLSGQPKRECQNDGEWDGDAPTCIRKSILWSGGTQCVLWQRYNYTKFSDGNNGKKS